MTEAEYVAALAEIRLLMDDAPGSKDKRLLVELCEQVAEYEMEHYPTPPPQRGMIGGER